MSDSVEIQVQTKTGLWQTVRNLPSAQDQFVLRSMQAVKLGYPTQPVRAVNSAGVVINII